MKFQMIIKQYTKITIIVVLYLFLLVTTEMMSTWEGNYLNKPNQLRNHLATSC